MRIPALLSFLSRLGNDVPVVIHLNSGTTLRGLALFPSADDNGVSPPLGCFVLSREGTTENDVLIDIENVAAVEFDK